MAGVERPDDTVLGLHVCKGNGTQSWIAEGGYEDICREVFQRADGFDVFLMEYDDDRSGSFEPLRHLDYELWLPGAHMQCERELISLPAGAR